MWVSVDGDWEPLITKIQTHLCKLRVHYRLKELQADEKSFKLTIDNNDYYIYLIYDVVYDCPIRVCGNLNMLKYCFFNITGTYLKLRNPFVCMECVLKEKVYVVQLFVPICIFCLCFTSQFLSKFIL